MEINKKWTPICIIYAFISITFGGSGSTTHATGTNYCNGKTCVRKCCPKDLVWSDVPPYGCTEPMPGEPPFLFQFRHEDGQVAAPEKQVHYLYGEPECGGDGLKPRPNSGVVLPNGTFYVTNSNAYYTYDEYCVENIRIAAPDDGNTNTTMLILEGLTCECKPSSVCVPKCCRGHMILHKTKDHFACVEPLEEEEVFNVTFSDIYGQTVHPDLPVHIVEGIPACSSGLRGDNGIILTDGRLYSTIDNYYFTRDQYCLEIVRIAAGSSTTTSMQPYSCPPSLVVHLHYLYITLAFFSILALGLLVLFICALKLTSLPDKCLLCYACCLIVFFASFVAKPLWPGEIGQVACVTLGVLQPAAAIAAFMWLTVMCYNISSNLRMQFKGITQRDMKLDDGGRFILYSVIVWGLTLTYVCITTLLQLLPDSYLSDGVIRPGIGVNGCYIKFDSLTKFVYVSLSLGVLTVVNVLLVGRTIHALYSQGVTICCFTKKIDSSEEEKLFSYNHHLVTFWESFQIFMLVTLLWPLVALAPHVPPWQLWVLPFILNSSQGVIIFFIFVRPPNKRKLVGRLLKRWFQAVYKVCRCTKSDSHSSTMSVNNSNNYTNYNSVTTE